MTTEQNKLADRIIEERVGWRDDGGRLGVFFNGSDMDMIVAALRAAGEPVAFVPLQRQPVWVRHLLNAIEGLPGDQEIFRFEESQRAPSYRLIVDHIRRLAQGDLHVELTPLEEAIKPMVEFGSCWAKIHYRRDVTERDRARLVAATIPQTAPEPTLTPLQEEQILMGFHNQPDGPAPSASVREALEEAANIANRFGDCPGSFVADRIMEFAADTDATPSPLMAAGEAGGQDLKERLVNPLHGTELRVEALARIKALEAQLAEVRKALAAIVALPASNRRSNMAFVQFERAKNIAAAALPKDPSTGSGS